MRIAPNGIIKCMTVNITYMKKAARRVKNKHIEGTDYTYMERLSMHKHVIIRGLTIFLNVIRTFSLPFRDGL